MPQFDSSAFWGIAGIVVGIIVATFFFIIGKKKTLLQHQSTTTPLITDKMAEIPGISIAIHGQPVKNLVSTTIKFFNSGNHPITSTDFAEQDKLRVVITGKLYGYDVSKGNQKLIPTLTPVNDDTINIVFENLKPNQYFEVTILHDESSLDVLGELKTGEMREYAPPRIAVITLSIFFIPTLFAKFYIIYKLFSNGLSFLFSSEFPVVVAGLSIVFSAICLKSLGTLISSMDKD